MKKLIPEKLKSDDVIGIIAPSDSIKEKDKKEIQNSIDLIEKAGFKVKFANNVYSNTLGYGATPQEKADDIMNMFKDKEIKAIFCAKGGENSNCIFDYLDYEIIKNNPKIICGFSDSTSITNVITLKTGLVTFNGPTFKSFTSWETDYGYKEVIKRFVNKSLEIGTINDEYKTIQEGNEIGKLIGGNISLLTGMISGKYKLNFENKILFIEELGYESSPEKVSGNLYYMKQNHVFDKIKGIWVGNYEHNSKISLEKILLDVLEIQNGKYNFPIIKSNNFGHTDKKTVIPIGITAQINTKEKIKIKLLENCVK